MTFRTEHRDRDDSSQLGLSRPPLGPSSVRKAIGNDRSSAIAGEDALRARAQKERPAGERRNPEVPAEREDQSPTQEREVRAGPRTGVLRRHPLLSVTGFVLVAVATAVGYVYWEYAEHFETTDDAFIASRQFTIAPEVSGYITAVPVTDNQHVAAGGVIARIDDRPNRAALEQAEAQVAAARASIENIDAQMSVQQAQITANQAQVGQAQATTDLARVTWGRDKPLVEKGWVTAQQGTIDVQNLKAQEAALENAQAALKLAQRQVSSLKAQRDSAVASLDQSKAQRDQAQLNLSYTTVTADQPGRVVQLSAAVGQFAQPGTALTMFVPDEIWVTANFKETQLDSMRLGQPVAVHIDAYPERAIRGHVASVQPGSGTAFSLLPAQNATGNFVKIVQRVPVKIVLDNPPTDVALGPGMSVVPTVRTDPAPSHYEQLISAYEHLPPIHHQLSLLFEQLRAWL